MKRSNAGVAMLIPLVVVVLIGGGLMAFKPKWLHGDSKRAATSTATTDALLEANRKNGAAAAASVTVMAQAAAEAPPSKETEFIKKEAPVALALLPPPDAQKLIEAAERKAAVLSGQLAKVEQLYGDAFKRADELQRQATQAISAKRASDAELERVAAERLGAEKTSNRMIIIAVVCGLLYVYTKLTHLGPGAISEMASDMRKQGQSAGLIALDGVTSRLQQSMVRIISKFKNHADPVKTEIAPVPQ